MGPESEVEIRKLAAELRVAINEHLRLAKISLITKSAVINVRDSLLE